jgi:hypothetical protein
MENMLKSPAFGAIAHVKKSCRQQASCLASTYTTEKYEKSPMFTFMILLTAFSQGSQRQWAAKQISHLETQLFKEFRCLKKGERKWSLS